MRSRAVVIDVEEGGKHRSGCVAGMKMALFISPTASRGCCECGEERIIFAGVPALLGKLKRQLRLQDQRVCSALKTINSALLRFS